MPTKRVVFLIFASSLLAACEGVETTVNEVQPSSVELSPTPTRPSEPLPPAIPLKPVVPQLKLGTKEKAYLDESMSREARWILETAESFEVFGETDKDETTETDSRTFVPNRVARISTEKQKKEILEAFYFDAAREDSPAVCYEPHHSLKATASGRTVEIEICFACSRFEVKGLPSRFWGTIVRENRKSEALLDRIIRDFGVEIER